MARLKLSFSEFPLVKLIAPYKINSNAASPSVLRYHYHKDHYEQILKDIDASRVSLTELQSQFIPARATTTRIRVPRTYSRSSLCLTNNSTIDQCEVADASATAASNVLENQYQTHIHKSDAATVNQKELPSLEQLLRDYDPTEQHLDPLMTRTFYFPALEELFLKHCKEYRGSIPRPRFANRPNFMVRLVRHLTRFRERDANDSPTRLRRVDLRDTGIYEGSSEVRLMRLLAPHVEFLVDRKPRITISCERVFVSSEMDWI